MKTILFILSVLLIGCMTPENLAVKTSSKARNTRKVIPPVIPAKKGLAPVPKRAPAKGPHHFVVGEEIRLYFVHGARKTGKIVEIREATGTIVLDLGGGNTGIYKLQYSWGIEWRKKK